jgi:hypothetical protein
MTIISGKKGEENELFFKAEDNKVNQPKIKAS